MNYQEAIDFIDQKPDALHWTFMYGDIVTLRGHMMKGFLIPTDTNISLMRLA